MDYYLSHGNSDSDLSEYGRVIKDAYRVEECFHRGKGGCPNTATTLVKDTTDGCVFLANRCDQETPFHENNVQKLNDPRNTNFNRLFMDNYKAALMTC